ncbi:uncharacterized protein LOC107274520 isoform X2 [Cephus cinctus]|uniref:Uncharacterized protein LOC107274520 isoform X2 n=1 Tax=Cephus cinctus TaxID=211228 RepID=A0AAJ7FUN8_CEPCN|nr:uncharacterized protein LOC107274520 isoform X2 [Cephus cinctus]
MTDLLIGIAGNGFPGPGPTVANGNVVFRNPPTGSAGIYRNSEMRHSRSEDLLGTTTRTPSPLLTTASEDDLVAATALRDCSPCSPCPPCPLPSRSAGSPGALADHIDPGDSIRDIVTENDLYRFVLFKRHYDKYVALAARYEEARGIAYYLEERYHEVKAERNKIEAARQALEKRLEGCEAELRDKEEELFIQLERSLRLEDEAERVRADRDACIAARDRLECERAAALRQLQLQASQNEITRRSLERARQDVVRQATVIRAERDALERENEILKERLRAEQGELGAERRRREEGVAALSHEATTLRHAARHLRAATLHATSCRRRRRCSVCLYAKRTFGEVDEIRDDGKLFKCLQAPLQDLRTWLRPSTPAALPPLRTSSPLEHGISYIDDSSSSSEDEAFPSTPVAEVSLSSANSSAPPTARAFSSDSGFSSETGDRRSRSYEGGGSSRKISESSSSELDGSRAGGFTRSRWTSSFRKLLGRKSKAKSTTANQSS